MKANLHKTEMLRPKSIALGLLTMFAAVPFASMAQDSTAAIKKEIKTKHVKIQIYDKDGNGDSLIKEYRFENKKDGKIESANSEQNDLEWIDLVVEEAMEEADEAREAAEEIRREAEEMRHEYEIEVEDDIQHGPKLVEQSWLVLDLGFNIWLTKNGADLPEKYDGLVLNNTKSANFHLGIIQQGLNIYRGKLRLVYGVGIEFNNYAFKKNVDLVPDSKTLTYTDNQDIKYRKNKLVSNYATMPLMLNFKSNPNDEDESFNIAAGVQLGYLLGAHTKQKWSEGGKKEKSKQSGDFNMVDYRMGYVVQFGYGDFNLYAKYYPNGVFKNNQGPVVNTTSVGLVLTPF